MKLLLAIGGAVAAAGVFLLATASAETTLLATHYPLLLLLNATLAALLAGLVIYQLIVLARRYRARAGCRWPTAAPGSGCRRPGRTASTTP